MFRMYVKSQFYLPKLPILPAQISLYQISSYFQLNDEARADVEQLQQPDGELPSIRRQDATFWDFDRLKHCLILENEKVFLKGLKLFVAKKPNEIETLKENKVTEGGVSRRVTWSEWPLIKMAIRYGMITTALEMTELREDWNHFGIYVASGYGSWECLQKLFEQRKAKGWKPLDLANIGLAMIPHKHAEYIFKKVDDKANLSKCVDAIFQHTNIDDGQINQQTDGYSTLHLAVLYDRPEITFDLLKKGAYIGMQDKTGWPVIWNINPKTLEQYFDRCICTEYDCYLDGMINVVERHRAGEDSVVFNFENLISPSEDYPNDMTAIEYMSYSKNLHHLLEHPLIECFLFLKWDRLRFLFYADFLCYFILSLIIGCISMQYLTHPTDYLPVMCVFTLIFSIYLTLRRTLQLVFCSSTHLHSCENYVNCLQTTLIIVFLVLF